MYTLQASVKPLTENLLKIKLSPVIHHCHPDSNFQLIVATNGNNPFGIALYVNVRVTAGSIGSEPCINYNNVLLDSSSFSFGKF